MTNDGLQGEIICNHDEGDERSIDEGTAIDVAAFLSSARSIPMPLDRADAKGDWFARRSGRRLGQRLLRKGKRTGENESRGGEGAEESVGPRNVGAASCGHAGV